MQAFLVCDVADAKTDRAMEALDKYCADHTMVIAGFIDADPNADAAPTNDHAVLLDELVTRSGNKDTHLQPVAVLTGYKSDIVGKVKAFDIKDGALTEVTCESLTRKSKDEDIMEVDLFGSKEEYGVATLRQDISAALIASSRAASVKKVSYELVPIPPDGRCFSTCIYAHTKFAEYVARTVSNTCSFTVVYAVVDAWATPWCSAHCA